jgi:hypothetical protein
MSNSTLADGQFASLGRPGLVRTMRLVALIAALLPVLSQAGPVAAAEPPFHELWRQGGDVGFDGWSLVDARVIDGQLSLAPAPDGAAVWTGTALGPERETGESFGELIPSWNAETPQGTWVEVRLRARIDGRWTAWYVLGVWSSDGGERRRSVGGQDDADARVLTDTLALRAPGQAYQLALDLFSTDSARSPTISLAAVLASRRSASARLVDGEPQTRGATLDVPERSQMVYPGGGEVWCSPTSTSMVMAYWAERLGQPTLELAPPDVAAGTYDAVYRGHGNWPFNTAYAARDGLLGYVSRFSSVGQAERWIATGVPVIASLAWQPGQLANAPVRSTDGHLLVIVGFSQNGDVVVNDPAGDPRRGQAVRRVYQRDQFESLWLASSGGTVYLIYPAGQSPPARDAFGAW